MCSLKTPSDAKKWLRASGISISDFARQHDLDPATTYQVLSGAKKGYRGKAHKAAVALGIKANPLTGK
ncbi:MULTISPECIES: DNA-binding protein [Pseudomonas]|uniref:DNA-binding protein n=1 Tax=Pseudomonas TaxID=286 RepID=UPI001F19C65C|nr:MULTISPECIES: DNA-binding protein [Pseudomonas]MCF3191438.1 DNA-binding protein [Pseudomonas bubulae]WRT58661.1 DNA-binding protein [Pseudomonas fragi]